ncbi:MAG: nickel pincer cofactor biosynthesis protein LarC [Eubacteriales bacterium]|nr:nickel pincer cofactor biosynthesis protein LarC [Eubacteriales bacterium]
MKTLYLECSMGIAGDMLMSALYEIIPDKEEFLKEINSLNIKGALVKSRKMEKCGIWGTYMEVLINGEKEGHDHHHHHHEHNSLEDINTIINSLNVSETVKNNAIEVYKIIAEAEGKVHEKKVDQIHFHEVGNIDAIVDIVGNCILLDKINADKIVVSPIHVGSGQVKCAHGILPVPAPATALILQEIPIYSGDVSGELCTPTGAAIVKHFADEFGPMPEMKMSAVGYGMGTKDFHKANCVRAIIGKEKDRTDQIVELAANLDDMTAEAMGFAIETFMEKGALDAYGEPIVMKKSRPGTKLVCICNEKDKETMLKIFFKHTSTLGVREYRCKRWVLDRYSEEVETSFGKVNIKTSEGFGVKRVKVEFDNLAKIARENDISLEEVNEEIKVEYAKYLETKN